MKVVIIMRVYEVIGVDHISGVSKKNGQAYDITTLMLAYEDPAQKSLVGKAVMELRPFRDLLERCSYYPAVGDLISLEYDRMSDGRARLVSINLCE